MPEAQNATFQCTVTPAESGLFSVSPQQRACRTLVAIVLEVIKPRLCIHTVFFPLCHFSIPTFTCCYCARCLYVPCKLSFQQYQLHWCWLFPKSLIGLEPTSAKNEARRWHYNRGSAVMRVWLFCIFFFLHLKAHKCTLHCTTAFQENAQWPDSLDGSKICCLFRLQAY